MPRDIAHEQISASTTEELRARMSVLSDKLKRHGGLFMDDLSEFHTIKSELYCRERGIQSEPCVIYTGI